MAWLCVEAGWLTLQQSALSLKPSLPLQELTQELTQPVLRRQVACGARHSCALTQAGALYTWGCNLHRQCGVPCQAGANIPAPTLVQPLGGLRVTCMAAGLHHAIVCTDAGEPLHMTCMM